MNLPNNSESLVQVLKSLVIILSLIQSGILASAQSAPLPPTNPIEPRVESILQQMTLEEKVELIGGPDESRGVPRLSVPMMRMSDGPLRLPGILLWLNALAQKSGEMHEPRASTFYSDPG